MLGPLLKNWGVGGLCFITARTIGGILGRKPPWYTLRTKTRRKPRVSQITRVFRQKPEVFLPILKVRVRCGLGTGWYGLEYSLKINTRGLQSKTKGFSDMFFWNTSGSSKLTLGEFLGFGCSRYIKQLLQKLPISKSWRNFLRKGRGFGCLFYNLINGCSIIDYMHTLPGEIHNVLIAHKKI